jgi:hypothetical protein
MLATPMHGSRLLTTDLGEHSGSHGAKLKNGFRKAVSLCQLALYLETRLHLMKLPHKDVRLCVWPATRSKEQSARTATSLGTDLTLNKRLEVVGTVGNNNFHHVASGRILFFLLLRQSTHYYVENFKTVVFSFFQNAA